MTQSAIQELKTVLELQEKATPGEWDACHKGVCPCSQIWGEDHPVAEVIRGNWGDTYPAIRIVEGEGMSGTKAESYLERIDYGEVSDDTANANAKLIVAAVNLLRTYGPALLRALECQWLPIESAPRDGSSVVVFGPGWKEPSIANWNDHFKEWEENSIGLRPHPNVWQPLPPPPDGKEGIDALAQQAEVGK